MSDKNENPQDNTFVRQDYEPLKDIVRRNQERQIRLNVERAKERESYEPYIPQYEPISDTKEALHNMTRPDVFARGRMRKSGPYPKVPYKRNNK